MEQLIARNGHQKNGILIGMLLGDTYIGETLGGLAYMQTDHNVRCRDYLLWKKRALQGYFDGKITYKKQLQKRWGTTHESYRWYVSPTKKLIYLRKDFYPTGTKRVTQKILNRLTPAGLACWYMDDGHLDRQTGKSPRIVLSTKGFTSTENQMICEWFRDKLGIDARLRSQNDIRINVEGTKKFLGIVAPFVAQVESMRYKIPEIKTTEPQLNGYVWQLFPAHCIPTG